MITACRRLCLLGSPCRCRQQQHCLCLRCAIMQAQDTRCFVTLFPLPPDQAVFYQVVVQNQLLSFSSFEQIVHRPSIHGAERHRLGSLHRAAPSHDLTLPPALHDVTCLAACVGNRQHWPCVTRTSLLLLKESWLLGCMGVGLIGQERIGNAKRRLYCNMHAGLRATLAQPPLMFDTHKVHLGAAA